MVVTLKDVAQAANLSVASVSRILTNRGRYSETTAKRVREIAREMGYFKNQSAADLASKKSRAVGVVVPLIHTNFADEIIKGLYEATVASGYELLITYLDDNEAHQTQVFNTLLTRQVGAVFLLSLDIPAWMMAQLTTQSITIISLTTILNEHISAVTSNEFIMMDTLVDHLVSKGHTNIALIGDTKLTTNISSVRRRNFIESMKQHQLTTENAFFYGNDHSYETGYQSVTEGYAINALPFTAAIATADLVGVGIVNAMNDANKSIPNSLSVVTIDGLQLTEMSRPQLTTIQQNFAEIGRIAMNLFIENSIDQQQQIIYVPTKLIERDSVLDIK
ncbi:LacI family transcriptional regulator [Weissella paramesenteroides]|jgi:DNA-binding LacI/PurR family transcriptional regulator|nr:LacI family transcriptional regulator [Weissella paramesenteroides]KAA8438502.1 LacI family transcriptional regulator [Weissella paramesenteroides]